MTRHSDGIESAVSKPTKTPKPKLHPKRLANPDAKCPRHPKKEWRPLIEAAWDAGWWCERRTYIYCYPPDQSKDIVKVPLTPSGWRTIRNVKRNFNDSGLQM
jgi:hypothetical protein